MTEHTTGTRQEWLAARLELLAAEKELTRRGDELARKRQELPWVRVDKDYRFETDEGSASLADLFRGRSQLLGRGRPRTAATSTTTSMPRAPRRSSAREPSSTTTARWT
jgi:hypothetical protein